MAPDRRPLKTLGIQSKCEFIFIYPGDSILITDVKLSCITVRELILKPEFLDRLGRLGVEDMSGDTDASAGLLMQIQSICGDSTTDVRFILASFQLCWSHFLTRWINLSTEGKLLQETSHLKLLQCLMGCGRNTVSCENANVNVQAQQHHVKGSSWYVSHNFILSPLLIALWRCRGWESTDQHLHSSRFSARELAHIVTKLPLGIFRLFSSSNVHAQALTPSNSLRTSLIFLRKVKLLNWLTHLLDFTQ